MDGLKPAVLAAFVVMGAGLAAAATPGYAQADAAETNVFLGQVFHVDVIVKAPAKPEPPALEGLEDFHVAALDGGRPTGTPDTWLYRFAFRARREGDLAIPPLRFGGLATEPVGIAARKPQPSAEMKIEQTLAASQVYVGEPVLLWTVWDSVLDFGAIKAVDFGFPVLGDRRFRILDLHEPGKEKSAQATGLPVQGTRVLATRKSYQADGVQHQSLAFGKLLIPQESGRLAIPPATLLCAVERPKGPPGRAARRTAFQYPAYFDNTFFDQNLADGAYERIYAESAPLALEVKPLPEEGRPGLFSGLVGDFSIAVTAAPAEVRVGEPVTLEIAITAAQHMEAIDFPPLREQPLLAGRFEIPAERALPRLEGKGKVYVQTVRPLSTAVDAVPPIQLAFFSPASNAYATVRSEPIPLRVLPPGGMAVFDGGAGFFQGRLRTAAEGIRHNYEGPDMLDARRAPLLGWAHPAVALPLLLLPPLLVGGLALVSLLGEKRSHIQRTAKAARAFKVFRRNAAHIVRSHSTKREVYGDLDLVLRAYLGDRLHLNPGALTFRETRQRLADAGADAQTVAALGSLFTLCEAYRFTDGFDGEADAKTILREATRTLRAVERTLK